MAQRTEKPRGPVQRGRAKAKTQPRERRYSRLHAPPDLALADWQIALRRQHGREQDFALAKLERRGGGERALREGFHPSYSEVWLEYGARPRATAWTCNARTLCCNRLLRRSGL